MSPEIRSLPRSFRPAPPARRTAIAVALTAACGSGWAQAPTAVVTTPSTATSTTATTIVITGNPLGRDSGAQPVSVLAGDELLRRRGSTLGETLDGLPGVSASGYGPNSSRPVIRGLDGDRIRVLDNGGASTDASALSFDHAVAIDPLVIERAEVLRGPAALLYGGSATGGVVNLIDNRIPRLRPDGLRGRVELRGGGSAGERAAGALLEGGAGAWAWHADAFGRRSSDLRVPAYTPLADGEALPNSRRVRNSAAQAEGGAIGTGWVGSQGHLGIAVDTYRNDYGITVEPDVLIRMQRDRVALRGQWRALPGPFSQVSVQASQTRYRHDEVEGTGEVGTAFRGDGSETRAELRHVPIKALGGLEGVVGLQTEDLDFSARGAEAFVPGTHTRSSAVFVLEELPLGALRLSAGLRREQVRVSSDGDEPGAEDPRFGAPAERRFTPGSVALGAVWSLGGARVGVDGKDVPGMGWSLRANLSRTERAPTYYELYADGVHLATAAYERGDPGLGVERSRHLELGLAWAGPGGHSLKASVFRTNFSRFISLDATGNRIEFEDHHGEEAHDDEDHGDGEDHEAETVPEYRFNAVRARLQGVEIEGRTTLLRQPFTLSLAGGVDWVHAQNLDRNEPLPRIAPRRIRIGLELQQGDWQGALTLRQTARQLRVPATDMSTPGHVLVDLSASWRQRLGGADALWFVRLANAGDRLAFNAAAVATVRGLSPAAGRALSAGVQMRF